MKTSKPCESEGAVPRGRSCTSRHSSSPRAGADHKRRTGLLVISRQEAAVFPTEGADKALLCRTALPLVADAVACVPLGAGTFCIVAADGGVALLQLAAWNGGLRGSALLCTLEDAADAPGGRVSSARTCSSSDRAQSDARDGGAMDVDASEKGSSGSCPEGGRHSPRRPVHISAANVLPLPKDSEQRRDTFGLLVLGTFAGPAQVAALPRNLIERVRSGDTPATRCAPVRSPAWHSATTTTCDISALQEAAQVMRVLDHTPDTSKDVT